MARSDTISEKNDAIVRQFEIDYWYTAIFFIVFYNVVAVIIVEFCRRYKYFQIVFLCIFIAFSPIYVYWNTLSLFGWEKILSVIIVLAIFFMIRYYKQNACLYWAVYVMFILNIFEAFLVEATADSFHLNAITAIIIILCTNLPLKSTKTIFIRESVYNMMNYNLDLYFVFIYTLWNYVFALNYKCYEKLLISTVHLIVPICFLTFDRVINHIPFCKKYFNKFNFDVLISEWMYLRACALLFWLYIESMPFDESIPFWDMVECKDQSISYGLSWSCNIISVSCAVGLLYHQMYSLRYPLQQNESKSVSLIQLLFKKCVSLEQSDNQ